MARTKISKFEDSGLGKIFVALQNLSKQAILENTSEAEFTKKQMMAISSILNDVTRILKVFENRTDAVGLYGKGVITANILTLLTTIPEFQSLRGAFLSTIINFKFGIAPDKSDNAILEKLVEECLSRYEKQKKEGNSAITLSQILVSSLHQHCLPALKTRQFPKKIQDSLLPYITETVGQVCDVDRSGSEDSPKQLAAALLNAFFTPSIYEFRIHHPLMFDFIAAILLHLEQLPASSEALSQLFSFVNQPFSGIEQTFDLFGQSLGIKATPVPNDHNHFIYNVKLNDEPVSPDNTDLNLNTLSLDVFPELRKVLAQLIQNYFIDYQETTHVKDYLRQAQTTIKKITNYTAEDKKSYSLLIQDSDNFFAEPETESGVKAYLQREKKADALLIRIHTQIKLVNSKLSALALEKDHELLEKVMDETGSVHSVIAFYSNQLLTLNTTLVRLETSRKILTEKRITKEQNKIARKLSQLAESIGTANLESYPSLTLPLGSLQSLQKRLDTCARDLTIQKTTLEKTALPVPESLLETYQSNMVNMQKLQAALQNKISLLTSYKLQRPIFTEHQKIATFLAQAKEILDKYPEPNIPTADNSKPETRLLLCEQQLNAFNTSLDLFTQSTEQVQQVFKSLADIPALLEKNQNTGVQHAILDTLIAENWLAYKQLSASSLNKLDRFKTATGLVFEKKATLEKHIQNLNAFAELTNVAGVEKILQTTEENLKTASFVSASAQKKLEEAEQSYGDKLTSLDQIKTNINTIQHQIQTTKKSLAEVNATKAALEVTSAMLAAINNLDLVPAQTLKRAPLPLPTMLLTEEIDKLDTEIRELRNKFGIKKPLLQDLPSLDSLSNQLAFSLKIMGLLKNCTQDPLDPKTHDFISDCRINMDIDFALLDQLLGLKGDDWLQILKLGDEDKRNNRTVISSDLRTFYIKIQTFLVSTTLPALKEQIRRIKYTERAAALDEKITLLRKLSKAITNKPLQTQKKELEDYAETLQQQLVESTEQKLNANNSCNQEKEKLESLKEQAKHSEQQVQMHKRQSDILKAIIGFLKGNTAFVESIQTVSPSIVLKPDQELNLLFDQYQALHTHYYKNLKSCEDPLFKQTIHGDEEGHESTLKAALDMSKEHLQNFIVNYYANIFKATGIPDNDERNAFFKSMSLAIAKALQGETAENLVDVCNALNTLHVFLQQNRKCVEAAVPDQNTFPNWQANFVAFANPQKFLDDNLKTSVTALISTEIEAFAQKYVANNFIPLPFYNPNACKYLRSMHHYLNDTEANYRKAKAIQESIQDKNLKLDLFFQLEKSRNSYTKNCLELADKIVVRMKKNAFLLEPEMDLEAQIDLLEKQYQSVYSDINDLTDIFNAREIDTFKENAEKNYIQAFFTLLKKVDLAELLVKKTDRLALFAKMDKLQQNTFTLDRDSDAKKQQTTMLERFKIALRFSEKFNRIITPNDSIRQQQPLETSSKNSFIKNLVVELTNYKHHGSSKNLKTFVQKNRNRHPDPQLQTQINKLLIAIYDQDMPFPPLNVPLTKCAVSDKIHDLYQTLDAMEEYGNAGCFHEKNQPTITLAQALKKRLDAFVARNSVEINANTLDPQKLQDFQEIFRIHLHTKDAEMNRNRGFFAFLKTETTRAANIRTVENALAELVTEEPVKGCWFW